MRFALSRSNHVCSTARLAPVRMLCARAHVNQGVAISTGYGDDVLDVWGAAAGLGEHRRAP